MISKSANSVYEFEAHATEVEMKELAHSAGFGESTQSFMRAAALWHAMDLQRRMNRWS